MNSVWGVWLLIAVIGLGTFSLRFSFLFLLGRLQEPPWLRRVLQPVPVVVMSALVASSMWVSKTRVDFQIGDPKLWAAAIAGLIAWRTKNLLITIVAGMASLWLFQWLLG